MPNREVNLTKRVLTANGWRYCAVALAANGRVKPDVVHINSHEERHPEARVTSNGAKARNGAGSRLGRTLGMHKREGYARKPSLTPRSTA